MGKMKVCSAIAFLSFLTIATSQRMKDHEIRYMVKYGYMSPKAEGQTYTDGEMKASLMMFQKFNGMSETGNMDTVTTKKMAMPRCGLKDNLYTPSTVRARRFTHAGTRWKNPSSLTYRYLNYSPDLRESQTKDAIEKGFQVWSDVSPLRFREVTDNTAADIYILFQGAEHGDGNPFDGTGGTLAHAYFPSPGIGGDAHFDESERFSVNGAQGIDLFQVAAHEFGHSMGLGHSSDPDALMAPFYAGYIPNFQLPQDDINGIQSLYGANTDGGGAAPTNPPIIPMTDAPTVTLIPINPVAPPSCNKQIDAISFLRTEMFVFQENELLRLEMQGSVTEGYPLPINDFFVGLANNIDASYERWTDGRIMFFKGSMYWEYDANNVVPGFPSDITSLGDLPNGIDAAVSWGSTGYSYFFKGSQYWRYNEITQRVDEGYPKDISANWPGVPDDLDGAFRWRDGYTYFVKDREYYHFDTNIKQVDESIYPRDFAEDWLGCPSPTDVANLTAKSSLLITLIAFLLTMFIEL